MNTHINPNWIAFSKPNKRSPLIIAWVGLMTGFGNLASAQQVLYVDANATGPVHDGSSWCNAFRHLEDALRIVQQGSTIRIADGVYVPPASESSDPRETTFHVIGGIELYGGFAGCGAPDPDERDPLHFETILSGDLNGDDDPSGIACAGSNCCVVHQGAGCDDVECEAKVCVSQPACCDSRLNSWYPECVGLARGVCCKEYSTQNKCENAYHVVTRDYRLSDNFEKTPLDGVTITSGYALGTGFSVGYSPNHWAGGLLDNSVNTELRGCRFVDNRAIYGGAVLSGNKFSFERCTFLQNDAEFGGAIYINFPSPDSLISDTLFESNRAWRGGAVESFYASPACVFETCSFKRNRAESDAGAVSAESGLTLRNCQFVENIARDRGGALLAYGDGFSVDRCLFSQNGASYGGAVWGRGNQFIRNSLFHNNTAVSGGAIFYLSGSMDVFNCNVVANTSETRGGGAFVGTGGVFRVANSILWNNFDSTGKTPTAQLFSTGPVPSVNYCNIQGLGEPWGGIGNISAEPMFANPAGADGIIGTADDDFRLSFGSPCIDAGDSEAVPLELTTDLAGWPRLVNDPATADTGHGGPPVMDMGAYEYQPVYLDILPGECPNELNPRRGGIVRVAVAGTPSFEVWRINPTSLALSRADGVGGVVKPIRRRSGPAIRFADVARIIDADLCACGTGGDGATDYVLSLSARDLIDTLELDSTKPAPPIRLLLTGSLLDGSPFTADDCVTIVSPRRVGGR